MAKSSGLSTSFTAWFSCRESEGVEMTKNELMVIMYKAFNEAISNTVGRDPLEAWTNFTDRFDAAGRRFIQEQESGNAH